MRGDLTVIDYLNKALRHELTAVNQYWLHYRLVDNWGYKALANRWRKESIEEMQHADKIIERIIFLDGFPNMQTFDALHIGQTVKEVVERDLQAEMEARALYEEAATHCHSVKDYVTRDLFEELMHDEEYRLPGDAGRPHRKTRPRALRLAPYWETRRELMPPRNRFDALGLFRARASVGGMIGSRTLSTRWGWADQGSPGRRRPAASRSGRARRGQTSRPLGSMRRARCECGSRSR